MRPTITDLAESHLIFEKISRSSRPRRVFTESIQSYQILRTGVFLSIHPIPRGYAHTRNLSLNLFLCECRLRAQIELNCCGDEGISAPSKPWTDVKQSSPPIQPYLIPTLSECITGIDKAQFRAHNTQTGEFKDHAANQVCRKGAVWDCPLAVLLHDIFDHACDTDIKFIVLFQHRTVCANSFARSLKTILLNKEEKHKKFQG